MNSNYDVSENVLARLGQLSLLIEDQEGLKADMGRRLANDLREHFRVRNVEGPRNKLGAQSSGFWDEIRDSVNDGEVSDTGVVVTISDPRFVQKYYGGTIFGDDKMLAIPARTEVYGKSPRLFSNLVAIFFKQGGGALIQEDPATPRAKGEKRIGSKKSLGMVFYWLRWSVDQAADHDALPLPDEIVAGLLDTVDKHVARILQG